MHEEVGEGAQVCGNKESGLHFPSCDLFELMLSLSVKWVQ